MLKLILININILFRWHRKGWEKITVSNSFDEITFDLSETGHAIFYGHYLTYVRELGGEREIVYFNHEAIEEGGSEERMMWVAAAQSSFRRISPV